MASMSCSSYWDGWRNGNTAAVLFKTACIFVWLPSSFFSKRVIKVQVVQLYNSTDTVTAWKNSHFILSETLDLFGREFINCSSCFSYAYVISLSVDEICDMVYNFREFTFFFPHYLHKVDHLDYFWYLVYKYIFFFLSFFLSFFFSMLSWVYFHILFITLSSFALQTFLHIVLPKYILIIVITITDCARISPEKSETWRLLFCL